MAKIKFIWMIFLFMIIQCEYLYPQYKPSIRKAINKNELIRIKNNSVKIYRSNSSYNLYNQYRIMANNKIARKDSNLSLVSQWLWGNCNAVDISGNYAFVGNGFLLQIFNIKDPIHPKLISQVKSKSLISQIRIRANILYLLNPLTIIDISDVHSPVIKYEQWIGGLISPMKLTISGNFIYIGDMYSEVFIFDISNPIHPVKISSIRGSGELTKGLLVAGTYLYVLTADGLQVDIFDISDKSNPKYISSYFFGGYGGAIAIDDSLLYLTTSVRPNFQIISIRNPLEPKYLGGMDLPGIAEEITLKDSLAFLSIAYKNPGFYVLNISNSQKPSFISGIKWPGANISLAGPQSAVLSNGFAYLPSKIALWIIDISNPNSMETSYFYRTADEALSCVLHNKYIYIADSQAGLKILDMRDQTDPKLTGFFDTDNSCTGIAIDDTFAYLLTNKILANKNLFILDISNPIKPVQLSKLSIIDSTDIVLPPFMDFDKSTIYIVIPSKKLLLIDIHEKTNPFIKETIQTRGIPHGISKSGNYLFVAEGDSGVYMYNISEPPNPPFFVKKVSNYQAYGILTAKDKLFFTEGLYLYIYDISNIPATNFLSKVRLPNGGDYYYTLSYSNNIIFLGYAWNIEGIDVSDPMHSFISAYSRQYPVRSVFAKGNYIYACNSYWGFSIFRKNIINSVEPYYQKNKPTFFLRQNYPNPFNSQCVIQYQIIKKSFVNLSLYNILGQKVLTFVNRNMPKGIYQINLKSENLSSGQYFIILKTERYVAAKTILLIK